MRITLLIICLFFSLLHGSEKHTVSFHDVKMEELVRFASKVSGMSFFYSPEDLQMSANFHTSKPMSSTQVVEAVISLLKKRNFDVVDRGGCLYIEKVSRSIFGERQTKEIPLEIDKYLPETPGKFYTYKLQYMKGNQLLASLKQIAADTKGKKSVPQRIHDAIESMQWVQSTNALLFSATEGAHADIIDIIEQLDKPLTQVFIEVLVLETSIKNGSQIGLQWAAEGNYKDRLQFEAANRYTPKDHTKTALSHLVTGKGFDFGVIGDLIFHKGKTFVTLTSLIDALARDTESVVVLNQKIIAQDSKEATIFVGDNIPFPGSRIETIGASQQTTSNIEYRDVGVSLKITPLVGKEGVVTLSISEEISEATPTHVATSSPVNGIQTTKTNMLTEVHVPDSCFVVLSGMIRNHQTKQRTGIPCLGGLPLLGAATSHLKKEDEKRNVLIFVRPHIVTSKEEYQEITDRQTAIFSGQVQNKEFVEKGKELISE